MASFTLVHYSSNSRHLIMDASLAYLAAAVKEAGHRCCVFDYNSFTWSKEGFLSHVAKTRPDVIGFKLSRESDFMPTVELARVVRELSPSSLVIAGGPLATMGQESIFNVTDAFDVLVLGEGELALVELGGYVEGERKLEEVRNLAFKRNGGILKTEMRLVENLDELPYPDWSIFDMETYIPVLSLTMTRGCPYHCAFCCGNSLWSNRVRRRSLPNILEELSLMLKKYGCAQFQITDPTPTPGLLEDMSEHIHQNGLPFRWFCYSHISAFKESLFPKLARGGCTYLIFGVESGNPTMLRRMGKGFSPEAVALALTAVRRCGMKVYTTYICGFPGETRESLEQSLLSIHELKPDSWIMDIFKLQPGSPVASSPAEYGITLYQDWRERFLRNEADYYKLGNIPSDLWTAFWTSRWARMAQEFKLDWGRFASSLHYDSLLAPLVEPDNELCAMLKNGGNRTHLKSIQKLLARCWERSRALAKASVSDG